jgi:hypothetical protein
MWNALRTSFDLADGFGVYVNSKTRLACAGKLFPSDENVKNAVSQEFRGVAPVSYS